MTETTEQRAPGASGQDSVEACKRVDHPATVTAPALSRIEGNTMTKITLHKVKRKTGAIWMLRWYDSRGKRCGETVGKVGVMTKRQAEHVRRERQGKIDNGLAKPDRPKRMTLSAFFEHYKDRRRQSDQSRGHLRGAPKLTEATITDHAMTLRYMIHHFGADQAIDSITLADATTFIDALEAGRLAEARKASKQQYGMSAQTVKGHIRNAKAAFNWAHRFSLIPDNPFADFDGRPQATEPNQFVNLKTFEKAVRAAPTPGWRAMFGGSAGSRGFGLRPHERSRGPGTRPTRTAGGIGSALIGIGDGYALLGTTRPGALTARFRSA